MSSSCHVTRLLSSALPPAVLLPLPCQAAGLLQRRTMRRRAARWLPPRRVGSTCNPTAVVLIALITAEIAGISRLKRHDEVMREQRTPRGAFPGWACSGGSACAVEVGALNAVLQ